MLKRCTALFCCLFCILCAGCSSVRDAATDYGALARETLAKNYSFKAHIAWEDMTADADLAKSSPTDIQVDFTAPETLEGLSAVFGESQVKVFYRGMEMDLGEYDIPAQSILPVLWELLSADSSLSLTAETGEETVTAKGSLYVTAFEITFEKETMKIQNISIPDLGAQVTMTEFEFS